MTCWQKKEGAMGFVAMQIGQLGMVAVIMGCAVVGTVGILKLIRRFAG